MKVRLTWAVGFVIALAVCPLVAQTPALSNIEAPYPALQSSVHIAGGIYGPGAVPYGPVGTPLVLSGSNFGSGGPGSTVLFPGAQKGTTIAVTPTSWSGSILLVTVPSGATSGLVQVSAQGKISNGLPLVVTPGIYAGSCPKSPPGSELAVTTSSLPNGTVGKVYSATLSAEGGSPPYTWSLAAGSQLPAGLSLSASSGAITGTPTATGGPYNLVVQATDGQSQAAEAALDLSVDTQTLVAGTVYSYAAVYYPSGNVKGYTDSVMGMWSFGYDALNRLMSATPGTGAPGGYAGMNLCMNYDAYGNRTQSNWQAACSPTSDPATASYNAANQVTWTTVNSAVNGFAYDAVGNVTNDGANQYLYDGEGRVCAVETSLISGGAALYGYIYDAEGRRVAKGTISAFSCDLSSNGFTLTESYVLGQGGEQLTTLDQNQNWQRTNVYGGGQLLATYDAQGLHFHLTDPLGTRRVQTSAVGEPEEDCQGLPFGDGQNCFPVANAPATADESTPLHFTGKQRDTESGLDYMEARYYASTMGRFMSPDPLGGHLENPQTLNRYVYAGNNPLSFSDPTGLDFYLQCQTASSTCASQTVGFDKNGVAQTALVQGVTNSDKSFTATQIGNDANGGLVDKTTGSGSYSANVSGSGVQFSQDGGKTSVGGVFVNHDANPTSVDTNIQGSGALSGFNFTFTNSKLEASQTAAGTFTYNGSLDDARSAMGKAGFSYFPIGGNFGFDEYRSDGARPDGANSGHFNIDRYKAIPINGVPQVTGNMHFGEHNPLLSPAVHIFGEARQ